MPFGDVAEAAEAEEPAGCTPSLPRLVERIGLGPAQLKVVLIAGAVWFADGAELLLISSVTEAVSQDWQLTALEEGLVVSFVYIGVFFGNFISGPIGDMYGRRLPIVASFWMIFVLSICSAGAHAFWSLCCFRIGVGISMGLGQPAYQALVAETTPASGRVLMFSLGFSLFAFGEMFSAVLIDIDDPFMEKLHWRWLLVMGALPAALFGSLAGCVLDQSPFYLACNGEFEEAREVLSRMAQSNSKPDLDVNFDTGRLEAKKAAEADPALQWKMLFTDEMAATTFIMVYTCFVLNFTFYGCLYAFPNVMGDVDLGSTPATSLIVGALVELGGLLIAIVVASTLPRRLVMKVYLCLSALSLLSFSLAATGDGPLMATMRFSGYYGIKFFTSIGYIVAYLYVTEVYPTPCRTTGTSICLAGGRLGAILSPVIFEEVEDASGSFTLFFYGIAGLAALNYYLIDSLVHETQGTLLRESAGDSLVAAAGPAAAAADPAGSTGGRG